MCLDDQVEFVWFIELFDCFDFKFVDLEIVFGVMEYVVKYDLKVVDVIYFVIVVVWGVECFYMNNCKDFGLYIEEFEVVWLL